MLGLADRLNQPTAPVEAPTQTADQQFAAVTRQDLARYREELAPLEQMYADRLMGPQAEADSAGLLQTVNQQTDQAFNRAGQRMEERQRQFGIGADRNQQRNLQRNRQLAKATNSTSAGKFYDRLRVDSL